LSSFATSVFCLYRSRSQFATVVCTEWW